VVVVVDVVDLEGQRGAGRLPAELAVGRGAEHDRVADGRVVHRHHLGPGCGRERDPPDDGRAQQLLALLAGQLDEVAHGSILPRSNRVPQIRA